MSEKEPLFTPIKIGNKTAPNRFALNAMECCDADENGNPSDSTYERYENYFKGQAGVVNLEAITIQYESRSRLNQLSIMPRNADALKKLSGAYDTLFDRPFPYMMALHQTPVNTVDSASEYYHFHIEFYPPLRSKDKQYFRASSETGAGAYCNVTLPENTAAELREALKTFVGGR
jgi:galactose-1-phosphate uridylyltransferase